MLIKTSSSNNYEGTLKLPYMIGEKIMWQVGHFKFINILSSQKPGSWKHLNNLCPLSRRILPSHGFLLSYPNIPNRYFSLIDSREL